MEQHVYTSKNYVLITINSKLQELGDWKYFDILVFKNKGSNEATKVESYDELTDLLKGYDRVYSFYKVDSNVHGAEVYDIILEEA